MLIVHISSPLDLLFDKIIYSLSKIFNFNSNGYFLYEQLKVLN